MHLTGIGAVKRARSVKAFVAVGKNDGSVMREVKGEIFQVPFAAAFWRVNNGWLVLNILVFYGRP
jgi:hypothetical protein